MKRPHRPRSRLTLLEQELSGVLGEETFGPLLAITRLRKLWPQVVGTMMAARTEPVRLEEDADGHGGRRLWVAVDHSIMAQQIRMLRGDILQACRSRARIEGLTQIRTQMLAGAGIPSPTPSQPRTVPLRQRKAVARALKAIKDDTLRRAMYSARIAQFTHADAPDALHPEDEA